MKNINNKNRRRNPIKNINKLVSIILAILCIVVGIIPFSTSGTSKVKASGETWNADFDVPNLSDDAKIVNVANQDD